MTIERRKPLSSLPPGVVVGEEVRGAVKAGAPIVALESAVMTHGLPAPVNLDVMRSMDRAVRSTGSVPAVCLVERGRLVIGATADTIGSVAGNPQREKLAVRDLGAALASGLTGGLTVSATLFAAGLASIKVFATGGIGGVHVPAEADDVSSDLPQLARSPVITVCSGAKSVLDLARTLESLETLGVPVFGYGTGTFPAFYLRSSGLPVSRCDSPGEIARIARAHWALGQRSAVIAANPIPDAAAIPDAEWKRWLHEAMLAAAEAGVAGKSVTPFLLERVAVLSGNRTVEANVALLESNAALAGAIAVALTG